MGILSKHKEKVIANRRVAVLVLAAFAVGFLLVAALWWLIPKGQQINTATYQAVYLNNGQMYFGKLQNTDGTYLTLKAPYMPQSAQGSQDNASALVKVKSQLWGPEDSIAIRADQVSFWQNLRADSKVTQAINEKQNQ